MKRIKRVWVYRLVFPEGESTYKMREKIFGSVRVSRKLVSLANDLKRLIEKAKETGVRCRFIALSFQPPFDVIIDIAGGLDPNERKSLTKKESQKFLAALRPINTLEDKKSVT